MNGGIKKYILVVGMGKTGNAIARFFKKAGKEVLVTDRDTKKTGEAETLAELGIQTYLGPHESPMFENAAMIVASPGIPLDTEALKAARSKGVKITGELDVIAGHIDEPIVAVTGTNGKTTVTTLISEMLEASGKKVFTCGNIGTPVAQYLLNEEKADLVVAEISSFQLDTSRHFRPDIAVLLNISDDHLDRYETQDQYFESKWSVFRNQRSGDTAVINARIPGAVPRAKGMKQQVVLYNEPDTDIIEDITFCRQHKFRFPEKMPDLSGTALMGRHNMENITASSIAAITAGADPDAVQNAVTGFRPLRHRLEYAGTVSLVDFYNDSKATNPDAVKCAAESFPGGVILIMGGKAKNTDFSCLTATIREKTVKLILMGEAAETICRTFSSAVEIEQAGSMAQAVRLGFDSAGKGQTVLLSPGCASFDMYTSYAERGDDFMQEVAKLGEWENESA